MDIELNVTQNANGLFDVTFTPGEEGRVKVLTDKIQINTSSLESEEQHILTFNLPSGFKFVQNSPPILWTDPPGTATSSALITQFELPTASTDLLSCTLQVKILATGPSTASYQFFFFIQQESSGLAMVAFVADPTIVTDPDPG